MKTFQIYQRAQNTAYKHIQAKPVKIEHNGRKYKPRRKNEAIYYVRRNYENFVLYGVNGLVYAAKNGAGNI